MILIRRCMLVFVLAAVFALPAAAQPDARADEITPLIPVNNVILVSPPAFSFLVEVGDQNGGLEGLGYTVFLFIKATDGTYSYKEELDTVLCSTSCTGIIPNDPDYQLVDGKAYKWWAKAVKDDTGETVGSMAKEKFTLDISAYESKIDLIQPDDNFETEIAENQELPSTFTFESHGLPQYRLVITRNGNPFDKTDWALSSCISTTCMINYTFKDLKPKTYRLLWRIEGRFPDVTGKAKSGKRDYKLVVTPVP